jgi:hypothetical protein
MSVAALLTDEEFLGLPDAPGKRELLDGKLIELPRRRGLDHLSEHPFHDGVLGRLGASHSK